MRKSHHSLHGLLRRSLLRSVVCMILPVCVLAGLLVVLTQRYGADIALTTRASEVRTVLVQDLPDEVWNVVSGRISFEDGRQRMLIDSALWELNDMLDSAGEDEAQYLNAALRAIRTIDSYVDQLETQMDARCRQSAATNRCTARFTASAIWRAACLTAISRMRSPAWAVSTPAFSTDWVRSACTHCAGRRDDLADYSASDNLEGAIGASLRQLEQFANRIAAGELTERVPPTEIDELHLLTRDLNTMAEQLGALIMSGRAGERPLKSRTAALQAQITPHFMYNTLETIVWLAEEGRNSEVVEMTMAFTGFLRISLSRGADYITVEREEQHVANYLQIQSVRYGSIMRYTIDIDPALHERYMLKIVLQPLVETRFITVLSADAAEDRLP